MQYAYISSLQSIFDCLKLSRVTDRLQLNQDLAAANAFQRRFFAGETGLDDFRTLADLLPISPNFDIPISD